MNRRELFGLLVGAAALPVKAAEPHADPSWAAREFWANGMLTPSEARERLSMVSDLQFTCDEFVDGRVLEPDSVVVRFTGEERL